MGLEAAEADSVASETCTAILSEGGALGAHTPGTATDDAHCQCIVTTKNECNFPELEEVGGDDEEQEAEDISRELPCGGSCLIYDSFLAHQRYFDDFKHSNHKFISYTFDGGKGLDSSAGVQLVIEQNVSLGKGGICWDAGFIMAEHLIRTEGEWSQAALAEGRRPRILELGAGTGLTGLALAQHCDCEVVLTDLPEFLPILNRNVKANGLSVSSSNNATGIQVTQLSWGVPEDISALSADGKFDLIIGADCVYSLVDREALARTIVELSGPGTVVYLTMKQRLPELEESFSNSLADQFPQMNMLSPISRNINPGVRLWRASGRHCTVVPPAA